MALRALQFRKAIPFYLFVAPAVIGFILFYLGPMLASLLFSFYNYRIRGASTFIGLRNYQEMLFQDPLVWQSIRVTLIYSLLGIPLRLAAQLGIAILLNRKFHGVKLFRALLYMPSLISGVALAFVWLLLFNGQFGVINHVLWALFRVEGPNWLNSSTWVIPSFVIMSFWQIGPGIVINLAGLQGIPQELYEAASIDGASTFNKFLSITVPMLSPVLFFNLVSGIIANFQVFTQAYVMTGGGPSDGSLFYVLYLYRTAFQSFRLGYASALAWLLFVLILILTLLIFISSRRWVYYEASR